MSKQPDHGRQFIVMRRFPTYDFSLPTHCSVTAASERLHEFLSQQTHPKGFVITDPWVDGVVSGETFNLRRREVAPYAEGYLVPTESGSNAVVRVQISAWWWLFDALVFVVVIATIGTVSLKSIGIAILTLIGLNILTIGSIWMEGASIAKLISRVLSNE